MNDSATLNAGECRCMHGHTERKSVGHRELDGESREGHSAEVNTPVAEGAVMTNVGHLCNKRKEHLHPQCRRKKRKKHIYTHKQDPIILSFDDQAFSKLLSPL